ncbi:unnamed protein product [Pieris macdunnoughi]|uniref:Uncharacterized protein n=1 Tax=Pieris macdunnoughi TaxID=345717 RepID=A0A821MLX8_9NEOP|nr:unnamed protein product [Pieris macdunnoughi]
MPEQEEKAQNEQQNNAEVPVRERTQTDDLNKKLLTSLFNRMNEGDSMLSKMLEPDNESEENEEWKPEALLISVCPILFMVFSSSQVTLTIICIFISHTFKCNL